MQRLTVTQVATLARKSTRQIRNLCSEGKLPCYKEEISTGTRYLIYTDTEEFIKLCGKNSMENIPIEGIIVEEPEEGTKGNLKEIISDFAEKLERLSKEAGKAELLTDNLITREQDVKYWQEKYFEVQQALNTSNQEKTELKFKLEATGEELKEAREEISSLKQKTFFGIKLR